MGSPKPEKNSRPLEGTPDPVTLNPRVFPFKSQLTPHRRNRKDYYSIINEKTERHTHFTRRPGDGTTPSDNLSINIENQGRP